MTATFTVDLFSTVDGFGTPKPGTWGGYWNKESAALLDHRLALYSQEHRMVFGANTYRMFVRFQRMAGSSPDAAEVGDAWVRRMLSLPTTVVSNTLDEPLEWRDATLRRGNAVDVGARLKEESEVPLRSHGSLRMNLALMAAGLVDRVQLTIFPVITGASGGEPLFANGADFDLELIESHSFDGGIQELTYRPTLHT